MFISNIRLDYQMANISNNHSVDHFATFSYFGFFFTLYLLPIFIVNILLLMAIITEKTIPAIVRVILSNIVASSEVVIIGGGVLGLRRLILLIMQYKASDFVCRLSHIVITSGAAGRLLFMATYAVTVYVLARYASANLRESKFKLWPTLLAVVMIWVFATAPRMIQFSPAVLNITFVFNHICIPHSTGPATFINSFFFIIVYRVCCFVISIIVPILTVRYIKKNCISENKETLKRMNKFSIFLLVGNFLNMMGISLPILLAISIPVVEENRTLVLGIYILAFLLYSLSLLTTPINFLIFFKPVRQRFKTLICCICSNVSTKCTQRQLSVTDGNHC